MPPALGGIQGLRFGTDCDDNAVLGGRLVLRMGEAPELTSLLSGDSLEASGGGGELAPLLQAAKVVSSIVADSSANIFLAFMIGIILSLYNNAKKHTTLPSGNLCAF